MIEALLITLALGLASTPELGPQVSVANLPTSPIAVDDWYDCGSDGDCADGEFCRFPRGECGEDGTCSTPPDVCGMDYDPVCGCDGQTYSNACDAHSNGISVDYAGSC